MSKRRCAACGARAQGNHSIHRDGFCEGPEVPLCDGCGKDETPTLAEIWERIRIVRQVRRQERRAEKHK